MKNIFLHLYNWLISPIPFTRLSRAKAIWLRCLCGVKIGDSVIIKSGVKFLGRGDVEIGHHVEICEGVILQCCGGKLNIGDNVEINQNTIIAANYGSTVIIESNVRIAHMVSIKGSTHEISSTGVAIAGKSMFRDISIGSGSWLCAGAIILPGVRVAPRTCVAAGAVVTKDTQENSLVAGVPAEVKKIYSSVS